MNKDIEQLSKDFLSEVFKFSPPSATQFGVHDYDELMPAGTLESVENFKKIQQKFYDDVEKIDPSTLNFDDQINREAILNVIGTTIFEERVHDKTYSYPDACMSVGSALHPLFMKEFAPFPERIRRIAARLEKVPVYLKNSREVLKDPVKLWVEMAIRESENITDFIGIIQKNAHDEKIDEKILERLDKSSEVAVEAIKSHINWLSTEKLPHSRENYAMKPEDFERLIEMRELGMDTDEMIEFATETLKICREKQKEWAEKIAPGKTIENVKKMLKANHPSTFEEALQITKQAVENSRQFVIDSDFVTLPEGEKLIVEETPSFARTFIPFGAYCPPGPMDKRQVGIYWMSRPYDDGIQSLEIHNMSSILNTSVHEGYPGHHVQMSCANLNKHTSRLITQSVEFIEGWAHYCEDKVAQMGFSTEPAVMFERLNDIIWRAMRIIVDIKLSKGLISFDEAVEIFQKELDFDKSSCISEIERYTITPGYHLSYLIGKKLILELAKSIENDAGENFNLKRFHDTMVYAGNLPFKCLRKVVRSAFNLDKSESFA